MVEIVAGERVLTASLNAKSRKVKTSRSNAGEYAVILQGKLGPHGTIEETGISAHSKVPRPAP